MTRCKDRFYEKFEKLLEEAEDLNQKEFIDFCKIDSEKARDIHIRLLQHLKENRFCRKVREEKSHGEM